MDDVPLAVMQNLLDMWMGNSKTMDGLQDLVAVGVLADRLEMMDIVGAVVTRLLKEILSEDVISGDYVPNSNQLERYAEVFSLTYGTVFAKAHAAARKKATQNFETMAATAGFLNIDEPALASLLDDDGLGSG